MHFDVRTFVRGQEDNDAIRRFVIYNFEEQLRLYPGQRMILLCDMAGAGLRNVVGSIEGICTSPTSFAHC